jgi:hypothetical protein
MASFVAIIISQEGAFSVITPDTIQEWMLSHGFDYRLYSNRIFYLPHNESLYSPHDNGFVKSSGKGRHSKSWFRKKSQNIIRPERLDGCYSYGDSRFPS